MVFAESLPSDMTLTSFLTGKLSAESSGKSPRFGLSHSSRQFLQFRSVEGARDLRLTHPRDRWAIRQDSR